MADGEWGAWRDMVLREIERQNTCLEQLQRTDTDIRIEIGRLKLCAAIWGAVAAVGATALLNIIFGGMQ